MNQYITIPLLLTAVLAHYPIFVQKSDLSRNDLFLTQDQLIQRLQTQDIKQITVFNVQTSYIEDDLFVNKLKKKTDQMNQFKKLFTSKDTFVSPYVDYNAPKVVESLKATPDLQIEVIQINFININKIEQILLQQRQIRESLIIVMFTRISSNVKLLQEITDQLSEQVIAAQLTSTTSAAVESESAQATSSNLVYNMTSNQLSGYLILIASLFTLWIGVGCMMDIQTPERFTRQNYFVGKES